MKHEMMWAYLIHLSNNMWSDRPDSPKSPFHQTLDLDEATWRQVIDFLPTQGINTVLIDVGDAIQYESHPEIAIPGAWSKDRLRAELKHMREIGLTPLPKLNFSACHDAWMKIYARMVSTPAYYKVCEDVIREVAEVFDHPAYFHLGLDEETEELQRNKSICVIRQGELWWHDVNFLFDCCEKVGARPWVWADPCWTYHGRQEEYMRRMSKSVLQSNWWYRPLVREKDGSITDFHYQAYLALDKAGFDQVPTVSTCWGNSKGAQETMELLRNECAPERVKGFMTAPWRFAYARDVYDLMNDAARLGQGKQAVYPELCR